MTATMEVEVIPAAKPFAIEAITYPVIAAEIEKLSAKYLPLKINGIDDKEGYKAVHEARMDIRSKRVEVEKRREELKAGALNYGRQVDGAAKQLTALLTPIEKHLGEEEARIDIAREAAKRAKEEAERAAAQARVDALLAVGVQLPFIAAQLMPEADYQAKLAAATEAHRLAQEEAAAREAERLRIQAEEDFKRKAEAEALARERAELDRIRAEQEAIRKAQEEQAAAAAAELERRAAEIAAERKAIEDAKAAEAKRIADEQAAKELAAKMERVRKEAAAQAEAELKARAAREAEAARIKAEKAEAKRKKIEALRPDKEKLLAFADELVGVPRPMLSDAAEDAQAELAEVINEAANRIREIASQLEGAE